MLYLKIVSKGTQIRVLRFSNKYQKMHIRDVIKFRTKTNKNVKLYVVLRNVFFFFCSTTVFNIIVLIIYYFLFLLKFQF